MRGRGQAADQCGRADALPSHRLDSLTGRHTLARAARARVYGVYACMRARGREAREGPSQRRRMGERARAIETRPLEARSARALAPGRPVGYMRPLEIARNRAVALETQHRAL